MVSTTAMGRLRMKSPAPRQDDRQEGHDEGWRCSRARRARSAAWLDRRVAAFVGRCAGSSMFSTTTMLSSTSKPRAMIIPTILSWLMVKPKRLSRKSPMAMESGDGDHHHQRGAGAERQQGG